MAGQRGHEVAIGEGLGGRRRRRQVRVDTVGPGYEVGGVQGVVEFRDGLAGVDAVDGGSDAVRSAGEVDGPALQAVGTRSLGEEGGALYGRGVRRPRARP